MNFSVVVFGTAVISFLGMWLILYPLVGITCRLLLLKRGGENIHIINLKASIFAATVFSVGVVFFIIPDGFNVVASAVPYILAYAVCPGVLLFLIFEMFAMAKSLSRRGFGK